MNINEIRLGVLGSVSDVALASQELADKSNEIIRNLIELAASQVTEEELEERIEQIPVPTVGSELTLAQVEGLIQSALGNLVASTDTRLTNARAPLPHAASHEIGGGDMLDLDSIDGELDASKLYGDAVLSSVTVDALVRAGAVEVKDDPTDPFASVKFQGSFPRIDFGTPSSAADAFFGRVSAGVLGALLGSSLDADFLQGYSSAAFGRLAVGNTWALSQIFSAAAAFQSPTVPFAVVGSDRVDNLNVEFLNGQSAAYYLNAVNLTGNLPYAQLPTGTGAWDVGSGNTLTLTRRVRLSDIVGVGVDPTSSTGFNCRPSTMTGTTQIGATYSPSWSVDATAVAVGLNVGGVGATKATPYTTTLMPLLRVQAPTRGGNQTITTLVGLYVEDLTAVTAGNRYPIEAVNSIRADYSSTADDTRLLVWDVTAGTLKRVSRGAADSGGVGFRLLRIPN